VSMIRPEAVDVDTKVVLVGSRRLFEMLLQADPEFSDLFKILADFSPIVELGEATTRALCGRIAALVEREDLLPFDANGLDALVELAVREAGDRQRIDLGGERVLDSAREASALARATGADRASRIHVVKALDARIHRLDRIEENLAQSVERGHVLLDVEGVRIGQLNALSVVELGTRAFGRVGRVTAAVGLGQGGVVNIEREADLSGARHDKGILILEGYIRDRFARTRPLSLVASVAFEQSYGPIDGDSASLAELLAILSRVGGLEVRQDLAVTGSINQAGEVQAVGGLNEKVEGFFDCCVAKGLTATQGVVIPGSNIENLTLRDDVVGCMEEGRFHIYPVASADEALAIFTGLEAGTAYEPGTANQIIDQVLENMAIRLATFAQTPPV
jgi:predicted ATP-dependent protease